MIIRVLDKKTLVLPEAYGFFVTQEEVIPKGFKDFLGDNYYHWLDLIIKRHNFTGKALEVCVAPLIINEKLTSIILVGLGTQESKKKIDIERYRRAVAVLYKRTVATKAHSLICEMPPEEWFNESVEDIAQEAATIFEMTAYHFDEFLTDKARKETAIETIYISVDTKVKKDVAAAIIAGQCIATAVNRARHWIDLPPIVLTPTDLAQKAEKVAQEQKLQITIFDENEINKMGMGGLAGVSRGSDQDCKLVIMEYRAKKKNAPTIALVGKGITFDSGGLSIKPAAAMETMKDDMSGAAAVIAVMQVIAQFKPAVNVIGITPLAENMPSGKATRPGDIVRFYNGKTAEVKNTDAEGRLILADALSYAVKHYKLDAIIDIATLTGACSYALGPFFSGLLGNNEALLHQIEQAGERSGDRVWRLPLHDDFKAAIRSEVADLCNSGNPKYRAGTITGALFLQNFVDDVPWAHLDIAGTAFDVPDIPYYRSGATGASIRLLLDLIMHWQ